MYTNQDKEFNLVNIIKLVKYKKKYTSEHDFHAISSILISAIFVMFYWNALAGYYFILGHYFNLLSCEQ